MPLKPRTPKRHWLLFIVGGFMLYQLHRIVDRASEDTVVWVAVPVALVLFAIIFLAATTAGREALMRLALAAGDVAGKVVEMRSGGLLGGLGSFSVTSSSTMGPTPEEDAAAAAMNGGPTA